MSNTQPEALHKFAHGWAQQAYYKGLGKPCDIDGARQRFEAELHRLHALNAELLGALKLCSAELFAQCDGPRAKSYVAIARAAITKAEGKQ